MSLLSGFRGSTSWVHSQEDAPNQPSGPYWPGGASGVTLRPGVDLGYCSLEILESSYFPLLSAELRAAIRAAMGIRGTAARAYLRSSRAAVLKQISISYALGDQHFPVVADPYWKKITARFPSLLRPSTPGGVHTAFLSLAFNRGPANTGLSGLRNNIESEDWLGLAREIAAMQQDHALMGIRTRRRREAQVVRDAVALLAEAGGVILPNSDPTVPTPAPPASPVRAALDPAYDVPAIVRRTETLMEALAARPVKPVMTPLDELVRDITTPKPPAKLW